MKTLDLTPKVKEAEKKTPNLQVKVKWSKEEGRVGNPTMCLANFCCIVTGKVITQLFGQ